MKSIRAWSNSNKKKFLIIWRIIWIVALVLVWWEWNELPWYIFFPLAIFIALFDPGDIINFASGNRNREKL